MLLFKERLQDRIHGGGDGLHPVVAHVDVHEPRIFRHDSEFRGREQADVIFVESSRLIVAAGRDYKSLPSGSKHPERLGNHE